MFLLQTVLLVYLYLIIFIDLFKTAFKLFFYVFNFLNHLLFCLLSEIPSIIFCIQFRVVILCIHPTQYFILDHSVIHIFFILLHFSLFLYIYALNNGCGNK